MLKTHPLFIKDDNGNLRKLPVNDAASIQSDWAENNTGSPAHIKNREIVNAQFNSVNAELNTKLESAPLNGDQYGHQSGGWTKIEVQEAAKDSVQYVRKDGDWAPIEFEDVNLDGYATETFATNKAVEQGLLAEANAKDYTDTIYQQTIDDNITLSSDILGIVSSAAYLTDAPGSVGNDGAYYARQNGTWVPFLPGTGGGGGDGGDIDLSGYAKLAVNQQFSGFNSFSGGIGCSSDFNMPNSVIFKPWSGNLSGSAAFGTEMKWFTKTGGGGQGGGLLAFQQFGTNGTEVGNIKIGLRNSNPEVALQVDSSIRANQYQNNNRSAVFDGQTFTSTEPLEFQADAVFFNDVIQNGRVYTGIHTDATFVR